MVIKLYCFAPAFGLPSPGPFAIKTEVHLKMMRLPHVKRFAGYADAPRGKLPYIDDDGMVVADSPSSACPSPDCTWIIRHEEAKLAPGLATTR